PHAGVFCPHQSDAVDRRRCRWHPNSAGRRLACTGRHYLGRGPSIYGHALYFVHRAIFRDVVRHFAGCPRRRQRRTSNRLLAHLRACVVYVMVFLLCSMIFLLGICLTYAAVGTVNMAQIGIRIQDIPEGTLTAIFGVLLVAFGIKAAVVPLDAWLPDSYPTAPALVTAVFAGLLTKVGVYSIIRMRSAVFTDGSLDGLLMWVALATMLIGILGAMAQTDIKRLLSFTLVSHIGYMIFGVAIGTAQGLSGAIFY